MKIIDEIILYENPDPLLVSKQGIFPGIVKSVSYTHLRAHET